MVNSLKFKPGYAYDDRAAILFYDQDVHKLVALSSDSNAYYVYLENFEIKGKAIHERVVVISFLACRKF